MKKKFSNLKIGYHVLSGYTKAKNCTDFADIKSGIDEIREFIKLNYPANCKLAYKRLNALEKKLSKLTHKNQTSIYEHSNH